MAHLCGFGKYYCCFLRQRLAKSIYLYYNVKCEQVSNFHRHMKLILSSQQNPTDCSNFPHPWNSPFFVKNWAKLEVIFDFLLTLLYFKRLLRLEAAFKFIIKLCFAGRYINIFDILKAGLYCHKTLTIKKKYDKMIYKCIIGVPIRIKEGWRE